MKAVIRRLHSPDIHDLENWRPPDPTCFGFLLQAIVGPEGGGGEESFDFVICTSRWLEQQYWRKGIVFLRHHVLVFEYDFSRIRSALEAIVSDSSGGDWSDIGTRLARYGKWELEDYRE